MSNDLDVNGLTHIIILLCRVDITEGCQNKLERMVTAKGHFVSNEVNRNGHFCRTTHSSLQLSLLTELGWWIFVARNKTL